MLLLLNRQRLEFRETEAARSCRTELWRRGGKQKRSFTIPQKSLLKSLLNTKKCMHRANRKQGLSAEHFPEHTERRCS